MRYLITT